MSQDELFDIYDERMQPAGTASRKQVHSEGLWHRTFQCWILAKEKEETFLLFQRRHPHKDTYPGLLDISCAGHLTAGERIEDGCRELQEELGVETEFGFLEPCGVYKEDKRPGPGIIDRESCHVFLYRSDAPLLAYRLQLDEVTGLYRIPVSEVKKMAMGQNSGEIRAVGVEPDNNGRLRRVESIFSIDNFVPRAADYYALLFAAIE